MGDQWRQAARVVNQGVGDSTLPPAPGRPEISFNVPQTVCGLGASCIGEHRLT